MEDDLALAEAIYRKRAEDSFLVFVRGLVIPSAHGPVLFDDVMAPFQRETFGALAPSLQAVRDGLDPPIRRFWIERTKKAGKDSDLAACLLWLVAFPRRPFKVQVTAADRDQAGILKVRIDDLIYYNEWLKQYVHSVQNRVTSLRPGLEGDLVRLTIEATGDAGAQQGATPDVLVLNELVHVAKWDTMQAHMQNADGTPWGVAIVSTNAGFYGTKAELWRRNARSDPRWWFHAYSQPAPWIRSEDLEDAKRRDPIGKEFDRLWLGRWVSGRGGAVDEDSIARCFRAAGPVMSPEPGWQYVAGLDLGISHDHSGVAVIGVQPIENRLRVVDFKAWLPEVPNDRGTMEVDLQMVEENCFELWRRFRIEWFGYDPAAGGSFMAQRLRKRGVPMREMVFSSAANLTRMANAFVTAVKSGMLECYDDYTGRLRRDFGKFDIVEKPPNSRRLVAVSDEYGHADVGTAVVIALPTAVDMLARGRTLQPDDELVYAPPGPDEQGSLVDSMPPELRAIYEGEGEVGLEIRRDRTIREARRRLAERRD